MTGEWVVSRGCRIKYVSRLNLAAIRAAVSEVVPQVIYLNSAFSLSTLRTVWSMRVGRLPSLPVVLAPRGELCPGALGLHPLRKWVYLRAARLAGAHRTVRWIATSELEKQEMAQTLQGDKIVLVPQFTVVPSLQPGPPDRRSKKPGAASFVHISRITPKKNLLFLLKILTKMAGQVSLDIYGSVEDRRYWGECERVIHQMPDNIRVTLCGLVHPAQVHETLRRYDFFVLPTLSENFGHAIVEALAAATPVLISDQTPWRDLETLGAGWDVPLTAMHSWHRTLRECVDMDDGRWRAMSAAARHLVENTVGHSAMVASDRMIALFTELAHCRPDSSSALPTLSPSEDRP
jgi:glycosyltransferase involved in cell wall biosynthesis